jgi:hypothetical protein
MSPILKLLIVTVLVAVAHPTAAQHRWLSYEPETVELAGRLVIQNKYGPPNYGEQPKTDEKVRIPVLILSEAVNVLPNENDDGPNGQHAYDVRQIQLAFIEGPMDHDKLIGQQVVVKGTLFHQHTGHHYTKVVMKVRSIERKPAGYVQQPVGVCGILTAHFNPRERYATSNSLLVEFVAPVGEEETEKSFKLPGTGLMINVTVKYDSSLSSENFKPELIGIAIAVSDKEGNARYASDNVLAGTNYSRNWQLFVTKRVVVDETQHTLTFTCRDGRKLKQAMSSGGRRK